MCSWCWGYQPIWERLQKNLPRSIVVEYVAGGLAPDSNSPMPLAQQQMIQNHWRTIEQKLGTPFNHDFWVKNTPRRSTYNACRAVIAAQNQACQLAMIEAIQQGYYLRALNPSDFDVLIDLARELSEQKSLTLAVDKFIVDMRTEETEKELVRQITFARKLSQQGFPSLVLEVNGLFHQIPIDYADYKHTLSDITSFIR
jgi:putative protein-disulfide isomerase